MKKSTVLSSAVATAMLIQLTLPVTASAHGDFLTDSDGNIVLDGYNECVSINKIKHREGVKHTHCVEAPKKVAKKPKPAPKPAPKPVVHENITLGAHALFDTNKSDLRAAGSAELDDVAAKLKSYYSLDSIDVVGHTDDRGAAAYNQGLSERRAAEVKDYLVSKGVPANKISTSGAGEGSPTASNNTAEGRQQNRRVEIMIKAKR